MVIAVYFFEGFFCWWWCFVFVFTCLSCLLQPLRGVLSSREIKTVPSDYLKPYMGCHFAKNFLRMPISELIWFDSPHGDCYYYYYYYCIYSFFSALPCLIIRCSAHGPRRAWYLLNAFLATNIRIGKAAIWSTQFSLDGFPCAGFQQENFEHCDPVSFLVYDIVTYSSWHQIFKFY